jgi:hypothetical protein
MPHSFTTSRRHCWLNLSPPRCAWHAVANIAIAATPEIQFRILCPYLFCLDAFGPAS